jgi:hypothetical protein
MGVGEVKKELIERVSSGVKNTSDGVLIKEAMDTIVPVLSSVLGWASWILCVLVSLFTIFEFAYIALPGVKGAVDKRTIATKGVRAKTNSFVFHDVIAAYKEYEDNGLEGNIYIIWFKHKVKSLMVVSACLCIVLTNSSFIVDQVDRIMAPIIEMIEDVTYGILER